MKNSIIFQSPNLGGGSAVRLSWLRLILLAGVMLLTPFAQAQIISIGKGAGILWEGMPFDITVRGPLLSNGFNLSKDLVTIDVSESGSCIEAADLVDIDGHKAIEIFPGVGLMPRATFNAVYKKEHPDRNGKKIASMSGTIGFPETYGDGKYADERYPWCISPPGNFYYDPDFAREVHITGTWMIIADGTQSIGEFFTIDIPIQAGSLSNEPSAVLLDSVLPIGTTFRMSEIDCEVSTPMSINFGPVQHNTTPDTELASQTNNFSVTCNADPDGKDAWKDAVVSLIFHPISGLFEEMDTWLELNEGGGYITGEINKNVTGSGECGGISGISFDNKAITLGYIDGANDENSFHHQITWRLCSGGDDLPVGPVTAAADMLVIYN